MSLSAIEDSWPAKLFLASFFPSINLVTVNACVSSVSFRKSMKKHRDMGHDSSRLLPVTALLEDLSCPFCLYRTKNKNYMIDHIVLHRGQSATPTGFGSQYPSRTTSPHTFFFVFSFQRSASSPLSRVARTCHATSRASSSAATNALLRAAVQKAYVRTWRSTMTSSPTSVSSVTSTAPS